MLTFPNVKSGVVLRSTVEMFLSVLKSLEFFLIPKTLIHFDMSFAADCKFFIYSFCMQKAFSVTTGQLNYCVLYVFVQFAKIETITFNKQESQM